MPQNLFWRGLSRWIMTVLTTRSDARPIFPLIINSNQRKSVQQQYTVCLLCCSSFTVLWLQRSSPSPPSWNIDVLYLRKQHLYNLITSQQTVARHHITSDGPTKNSGIYVYACEYLSITFCLAFFFDVSSSRLMKGQHSTWMRKSFSLDYNSSVYSCFSFI